MSAKFEFESKGKKYFLPAFSDLPAGAIRKSRDAEDALDKAFLIIESVADAKTIDAIDAMTVTELGELLARWGQGAPVGESSES